MSKVIKFLSLIKEKRKESGMTLNDVAVIVDCSKTHIWELENKRSSPSLTLSIKLATLFNINLNEL